MTLPSDMPDDYPWLVGGRRSLLLDQAELAARIGSFNVYDRRGQVIWFDHFQSGIAPWLRFEHGTGAAVLLENGLTYIGGFALKLRAGGAGAGIAGIEHFFAPAEINRWGVEA